MMKLIHFTIILIFLGVKKCVENLELKILYVNSKKKKNALP